MSDDSNMEELSGESLLDEALSMNTSESMFLVKSNGGEKLAERVMPHLVFIEEEIEDEHQRREHACHFVKPYMELNGHDPSDAEIDRYMECKGDMISCRGSIPVAIIKLTYSPYELYLVFSQSVYWFSIN